MSPVGGEDMARLREVAEAASVITSLAAVTGGERWRLDGWPPEATEFIATFDPPTVLALIARLEAAESARDEELAAVERVRALADEWRDWHTWEGSAGERIRAALTPPAPPESSAR